jgi:GDSL-like Lipase/Acylhydrolase family
MVAPSRLVSPADIGNSRADVRIFAINSQLGQARDPVVVVGDITTEGALLPSMICGHPVVNAGIGGMTPASYAGLIRTRGLMSDLKAELLVVALGTNNAHRLAAPERFKASYLDLLNLLVARSSKVALAGVPPIEDGPLAQYFDRPLVTEINQTIAQIAADRNIAYLPFNEPMPTVDGVHLQAAGYTAWLSSITSLINLRLGCNVSTSAQHD